MLIFAAVQAAPWTKLPIQSLRQLNVFPPELSIAADKATPSLWRIAHVLSLAYVTAWCIGRRRSWLHAPWATAIIGIGRAPLTTFVLASLASVCGAVAMITLGKGLLIQLAINTLGLAILLACGYRQITFSAMAARLPGAVAHAPTRKRVAPQASIPS